MSASSSPSPMLTVEQLQAELASQQAKWQQQAAEYTAKMNQEKEQLRLQVQQLTAAATVQASSLPSLSLSSSSSASPGIARIDIKPMVPYSLNGTLSNNPKQWLTEVDRYFKVASMSESDPRRVLIA